MTAYFTAKLIPGVLTMAAVPVWVRLIGLEEYGRFALAWAIAVSAAAVGTGWLRQAALRFAGTDLSSFRALPRPVIPASMLVAAAISVAGYAVVLRDISIPRSLLIAGFGSSIAFAALITTSLQRDGRARSYNVLEIVKVVATVMLGLVLVRAGYDSAVAPLAAAALANYGGFLALPRHRAGSRSVLPRYGGASHKALGAWWTYGWPLSIWLGLSPLLLYLDRMVLAAVADPDVVGRYAAVSDLVVRGVAMLSFPVTMALHPAVMRAVNAGHRGSALRGVRRWVVRMLLVLLVATGLTVTFGPSILRWLLGADVPSRWVLGCLLVGAGLWQVALLVHKTLEIDHRSLAMLGALAVALIFEFSFAIVAVRVAADIGVAVGLVVGAMAYLTGVTFLTRGKAKRHA